MTDSSIYLPDPEKVMALSNKEPETLGDWLNVAAVLWGEGSRPHRFIADKITDQGEHEPVVADRSQMLYLLRSMSDNTIKL